MEPWKNSERNIRETKKVYHWSNKKLLVPDPSTVLTREWPSLAREYDGLISFFQEDEKYQVLLRESYYQRKQKNIFTGGRNFYAPRGFLFLLLSELLRGLSREPNILASIQGQSPVWPRKVFYLPSNLKWP